MSFKVKKGKQSFSMPDNLSLKSSQFFKERYPNWEKESFIVYDTFSDKNKIFIDIGGWNGCTAIYVARLNRKVISLEPDPVSLEDYRKILIADNYSNIVLIERPIYSVSKKVNFAPLEEKWNTSSSQIKEQKTDSGKLMQSITLTELLSKTDSYNIEESNGIKISLIKIDIEGGEQYLLKNLLLISDFIPIYLSMHIEWWINKESISEWGDFFKRYDYIYATTSYGYENGDSLFECIPHNIVIDYIKKNNFASLVLTNDATKKLPLVSPLKKDQEN